MPPLNLIFLLFLFFGTVACAATVLGRTFIGPLSRLLTQGFRDLRAGLKKPLRGFDLWATMAGILLASFFLVASLLFGAIPIEAGSQGGDLLAQGNISIVLLGLSLEIFWPWALFGALVWCVLPRRTGWKNLGGLLGCCFVGPFSLLVFFSRERGRYMRDDVVQGAVPGT